MLIAAPEIAALEVFAPESVKQTGIGEAANAIAAASTTGITTVDGNQVPAAIRGLFGYGAERQAALFHDRFVQALSRAGGAHPDTGASNASSLRTVESRRHTLDGHS
jgi:PE family